APVAAPGRGAGPRARSRAGDGHRRADAAPRVPGRGGEPRDGPGRGPGARPDRRRGYYLVGLRVPCPALFDDMPWSTSAVLSRTLDRAQRLGLRVACLPAWFDVDTKADLERLAAELAVTPGREPRHTRDFVARRISPGRNGVIPDDHGHPQAN